uniref:VWFA domain-containing protein n=1 Tax=Panagrolaimus davidi TaxID=227884 RepID=A0A914PL66_9BILA
MDDQNLKTLSGEIATQLEGFTLGQNGLHTTRVAIILYATDITVYYKLEDTTTYEDLYKMLKNISNYANPTDGGGSLNEYVNAKKLIQ